MRRHSAIIVVAALSVLSVAGVAMASTAMTRKSQLPARTASDVQALTATLNEFSGLGRSANVGSWEVQVKAGEAQLTKDFAMTQAVRTVPSTVAFSVTFQPAYSVFQQLTVEDVPAGAEVTVVCSGRGCPFKTESFTPTRNALPLIATFSGRHLAPGALLKIKVTDPPELGKSITFTIRSDSAPNLTVRCIPTGSSAC